ncbi:MAG: DUF4416 family protein [Syntrophaceae bacterium]|nr:DUF4416 family protein [Syntrophaceae bacterium]
MSIIFSRAEDFVSALAEADRKYGPADLVSEPLSFHFTDYYEREMGKGLWRRMVGFEPMISPERLVSVKLWANRVEGQSLNEGGGRRVNIDPGYVAGAKFVLATGKDYSHRLYLGEGVYGEITLIGRKRGFSPLPWTYPDYASQPLLGIIALMRRKYLWQLKQEGETNKREDRENG